jgi:hypothetical protein
MDVNLFIGILESVNHIEINNSKLHPKMVKVNNKKIYSEDSILQERLSSFYALSFKGVSKAL